MTKPDIRKEAKEMRDALPEKVRALKSAQITRLLLSLGEYAASDAVCSYSPFGSEVSTASFLRTVLRDGKALFCPRVLDLRTSRMEFYRVFSPDTDLTRAGTGIPEPHGTTEALPEWIRRASQTGSHPQILFLMPGLAFDHTLSRTGYGGGFYDAYLRQISRTNTATVCTVAVAFSCQVFKEALPAEAHDIRPQMLITEDGLLRGRMP